MAKKLKKIVLPKVKVIKQFSPKPPKKITTGFTLKRPKY